MTPILTLNDYQVQAARTSGCNGQTYTPNAFDSNPPPVTGNLRIRMETVSLGIIGECGEFADYWKKVIGHGHPREPQKEIKELGDMFWYAAESFSIFGLKVQPEPKTVADVQTTVDEWINKYLASTEEWTNKPDTPFFDVSTTIRTMAPLAALLAANFDRILTGRPIYTADMVSQMDRHISLLCTTTGLIGHRIIDVLETNIKKLEARYPSGFTAEASQNRPPE